MRHHKIVPRNSTSEMEAKLQKLVTACGAEGNIQEILVAMAAVIQRELSGPSAQVLPHAGGLDPIMRAVEYTLRGDPNMNGYILQKLNFGTDCLNNWMSDAKPPVRA